MNVLELDHSRGLPGFLPLWKNTTAQQVLADHFPGCYLVRLNEAYGNGTVKAPRSLTPGTMETMDAWAVMRGQKPKGGHTLMHGLENMRAVLVELP